MKFEDLYKKVHAAIKADPVRKGQKDKGLVKKVVGKVKGKNKDAKNLVVKSHTGYNIRKDSKNRQWIQHVKLTKEQR